MVQSTVKEEPADTQYSQFGRYAIVRLLGKGAMGKVYLAHDPVLDRKVALKVIAVDPGLDKSTREDYFKRFSYEAKASAKLDHPSIVTVYDAGESNGLPWIAFQFIEGETLEKLLARRVRLPVKRAVVFATDIASALAHAHAWNIVHRDVKPANILIESLTGIAKLADFGIVKAPWAPATQAGNTLGSPGYMSPEQIEGSDLDERADLFCLGVVLYQMISGRHPFLRDTMAATVFATCNGAFTPLRDIVDNVPPKLDWIIRKCLEANRKRRLCSAALCVAALQSINFQEKPVAMVNLTTAYPRLHGLIINIVNRCKPLADLAKKYVLAFISKLSRALTDAIKHRKFPWQR